MSTLAIIPPTDLNDFHVRPNGRLKRFLQWAGWALSDLEEVLIHSLETEEWELTYTNEGVAAGWRVWRLSRGPILLVGALSLYSSSATFYQQEFQYRCTKYTLDPSHLFLRRILKIARYRYFKATAPLPPLKPPLDPNTIRLQLRAADVDQTVGNDQGSGP